MAGDWLKIEKDTPEKPEVQVIAEILGITPEEVFGRCFKVWRWGDSVTTNGYVQSVTLTTVDRLSGLAGFGQALVEVGWLHVRSGSLQIPNFDRHMGQSAKNRALTARRMARSRDDKCDADVTVKSSPEKRREEKKKEGEPPKPPVEKFVPPTVDEVREYCRERGNAVEPSTFVDFYTSKGWKVGDQPMKDWRAAVRTWEKNRNASGRAPKMTPAEKLIQAMSRPRTNEPISDT